PNPVSSRHMSMTFPWQRCGTEEAILPQASKHRSPGSSAHFDMLPDLIMRRVAHNRALYEVLGQWEQDALIAPLICNPQDTNYAAHPSSRRRTTPVPHADQYRQFGGICGRYRLFVLGENRPYPCRHGPLAHFSPAARGRLVS